MNDYQEAICEVRLNCMSFLESRMEHIEHEIPLSIDDCRPLEKALQKMCSFTKFVSDTAFIKEFPHQQAISITQEPYGLRLLTYPALSRTNNNCWAVIDQMEVWRRYFRLQRIQFPYGKYSASIVHHLPQTTAIPNTVEAHSFLNGICYILGIEDMPEMLDISVSVSPSNAENGAFELCMISATSDLYTRCLSGEKISFSWAHNCDDAVEILGNTLQFLDESFSFSETEIMRLFALVSNAYLEIRKEICFSNSLLREKRGTSIKQYAKMLKDNPFRIDCNSANGTVSVLTNAVFRNREQPASILFPNALFEYLNGQQIVPGNSKWRIEILRKTSDCDNDSIPFDMIFLVLKEFFEIVESEPLLVRLDKEISANTCICLHPILTA